VYLFRPVGSDGCILFVLIFFISVNISKFAKIFFLLVSGKLDQGNIDQTTWRDEWMHVNGNIDQTGWNLACQTNHILSIPYRKR
jgi:hypothetical protein